MRFKNNLKTIFVVLAFQIPLFILAAEVIFRLPVSNISTQFNITYLSIITIFNLILWLMFFEKLRDFLLRYKNSIFRSTHKLYSLDYLILFCPAVVLVTILFIVITTSNDLFIIGILLNLLIALAAILAASITINIKLVKAVSHSLLSFNDDPIDQDKDEILGRTKFIDTLTQEITGASSKASFVFGLYGGWGEGKTSIINIVSERIRGNTDFIVYKFNPWSFENSQSMLTAFYEGLENVIGSRFLNGDLKNMLHKYSNFVKAGTQYLGFKEFLSDLVFRKDDLPADDYQKSISKILVDMNVKIIVFVDDIDRLTAEEILQTFKLIKNTANFSNVIYVLSMDHEYVNKVLQEELISENLTNGINESVIEHRPRQFSTGFLEKIVQKPMYLPSVDQSHLDSYSQQLTNSVLAHSGFNDEEIKEFFENIRDIYQKHLRSGLSNLRKIKRLISSFYTSLQTVKREVNLYDFFLLEFLKLYYPEIYSDIATNPWYYMPISWIYRFWNIDLDNIGLTVSEDETKNKEMIKKHIDQLLLKSCNDDSSRRFCRSILISLFFTVSNSYRIGGFDYKEQYNEFRANKRLSNPECFPKYFILDIPTTQIPDELIDQLVDLINTGNDNEVGDQHIQSIFTDILSRNSEERKKILEMLNIHINKYTPATSKSLIKYFYLHSNLFSQEGRANFWSSEYDRVNRFIYNLINDKVEKDKIQSLLEEIIDNTKDTDLIAHMPNNVDIARGGDLYNIYEVVDSQKIIEKAALRLDEIYINGNIDIFTVHPTQREWIFILHAWLTKWGIIPEGRQNVQAYLYNQLNNRENLIAFLRFYLQAFNIAAREPKEEFKLDKPYPFELHKIFQLVESLNVESLSEIDQDLVTRFNAAYSQINESVN